MDRARALANRQLAQMEKRIHNIYIKRYNELTEQWNAYLKRTNKKVEGLYHAYETAQGREERSQALEAYQSAVRSQTLMNARYRAMIRDTTKRLADVNSIALRYINDEMPKTYADSFNYCVEKSEFEAIGKRFEVGIRFDLVDEYVVAKRFRDGDITLPRRTLDVPKDMRWNTKQLNAQVTKGLLLGESMDKIAKRVMTVIGNNQSAAIRNARTMVTGAENSGRLDRYTDLDEQGIVQMKEWVATPDGRTRDWHLDMDGQRQPLDQPFIDGLGNELDYPGDPGGAPESVYNCRCTMVSEVVGFRNADGSITRISVHDEDTGHLDAISAEREERRQDERNS